MFGIEIQNIEEETKKMFSGFVKEEIFLEKVGFRRNYRKQKYSRKTSLPRQKSLLKLGSFQK